MEITNTAEGALSSKEVLLLGSGELAFLGDAVYSLLVREALVVKGPRKAADLHRSAIADVRASAQAHAAAIVQTQLNEMECGVFSRGRNKKCNGLPHGCAPGDYALATALECVFGYLWLTGEHGRLRELFDLILNDR